MCFFMLYLVFNLKTKDKAFNIAFQLLGLIFFLGLIILIPKAALDDSQFCGLTVTNSTSSGGTISYEYSRTCFDNPNDTTQTFYVNVTWIIRIISLLLVLYFGYYVLKWLIERVPRFNK